MPTIARIGPYRFYFFSHEPNEPPHIHVDREAATLKAWLLNVGLARSRGFRPMEIGSILRIVEEHRESLLEAWYDYFGTDH
jgi:hypothetical protein